MSFYSCDPQLELTGQTALSLLQNINQDATQPYLAQHGLADIDSDAWYPVQSVLNVLNEVAQKGDPMSHFVALGIKAAELGALPEDISFSEFLRMYSAIYQDRHRKGDPGALEIVELAPYHVQIICDVVYPDHVMYGLIFGYARRLLPQNSNFTVFYDEDVTPRDMGGEQTIIHVTWNE